MRGRLWLNHFTQIINQEYKKLNPINNKELKGSEWTKFLGSVMEKVAENMNCWVATRRPSQEDSYEYLNIDAMFFDDYEYAKDDTKIKYDPFVLPRAVIELENSYGIDKISYCLWKILCVRSSIRVLICYQADKDKVEALKKRLENIVWENSLMKGTDSDLLILIGDESANWETEWDEYYKVYEWKSDMLMQIHRLRWD